MNELIYKQDAIDAIMSEPPDAHYPSWYATILKELPTVDIDFSTFSDKLWKIAYERGKAEGRKKGKWIDTGSGQECSECHEIQYGYDNFRYFCAFCGADMRGDSE